jgi:hypothetical protein
VATATVNAASADHPALSGDPVNAAVEGYGNR